MILRMPIVPRISLFFAGDCDAAFALYQQCLSGSVTFRLTWGDSPMADKAPHEWRDKIVHATLDLDGAVIHGGDVLPGEYRHPQGFQLQLNFVDAAAAERVFALLAEGGRVEVPLQETFWARRFGAVIDRFGVPWAVNCGEEKLD